MSQAPHGSFFIVSKTPTSDGKLLAITYNGVNSALTWILAPYDTSSQTVSPKNNPTLVTGTDGRNSTIRSLSSAGHNWVIKLSRTLGTGLVNTWHINKAAVGESIAKGPGPHSMQEPQGHPDAELIEAFETVECERVQTESGQTIDPVLELDGNEVLEGRIYDFDELVVVTKGSLPVVW
ncbi:hypothetical protein HD554DRAFT_2041777 [Boletus coccyginus]|nr:hypothetical protein HD554DRAFT_2041777 [Boletus coccyginus]